MNIAKKAIILLFVLALIVAAVPAAFGQDAQKAVSNTATANTETNTEPAEPSCRESDSGKDFWNHGVTKTREGSKEDYCDGTVLFEYYCDADKIQLTRYQCEVSCREGKCVKEIPPAERPTTERVIVRPEVRPVPAPNLPTDENKDDKDSSEKSLLERILKLERRVAELESLVQKFSSCCERPQPVPVPTPVPAPVDPCTERCGEVKLKCYSTCKVRAKGDDKSQRACEAQCAPEVERCYKTCRPEKEPKEELRPLPPVQEPKFPCAERCASASADCKEDCRSQYADLQKEANDKFPRKLDLCYQERCEPKMKECLRACEGREGETGTATQVLRDESARRELGEPTVAEASEGEEPQGDESEQGAAAKRRRSFFEWLFRR